MASAALIGLMLAFAALSIESARLYVAKLQVQRTADIANLAAASTAMAVTASGLSATARATALNIAEINGLGGGTILTDTEPNLDGGALIFTHVARDVNLTLGGLLTPANHVSVASESWANLRSGVGPCLGSLLGETRITGSARVEGADCSISSKTALHVCGTSRLSVGQVAVGVSQAVQANRLCATASVQPPAADFRFGAAGAQVDDPFASDPRITAIKARLAAGWPVSTVPPALLTPATMSSNLATVSYSGVTEQQNVVINQRNLGAVTVINSVVTVNAGGADPSCLTPMSFSSLTLRGRSRMIFHSGCYQIQSDLIATDGADARLEVLPGAEVTFVLRRRILNGSGSLGMGDATYHVVGEIMNTTGGNLTLGNGRKVFGGDLRNHGGTLSVGNGPHYMLNRADIWGSWRGRITFGDGDLYLWGGIIHNSPNAGLMKFGNGSVYSYMGIGGSDISAVIAEAPIEFGNGDFHFWFDVVVSGGGSLSFGIGDLRLYDARIWVSGVGFEIGRGGSGASGASSIMIGPTGKHSGIVGTANFTAIGTTIANSGGRLDIRTTGRVEITAPTDDQPIFGFKDVAIAHYGGGLTIYKDILGTDTYSGLFYAPLTSATVDYNQIIELPIDGCLQIFAGYVNISRSARVPLKACSSLGSNAGRVAILR